MHRVKAQELRGASTMAGTKNPAAAAATPSPPPTRPRPRPRRRPFNTLITLSFLLISAGSLWTMRIDTALHGVPRDFAPQVESGQLSASTFFSSPSPSSPALILRKHYTGLAALDEALAFLVAAFIAGPAAAATEGGWGAVRLQQLHFLVSFYAVVAAWAVEACRARRRSVAWTAPWALLYQTVGAAVVVPLFCVAHLAAADDDDGDTAAGGVKRGEEGGRRQRQVMRPGYARALLPATAVAYLVPTLAMYAHGHWGGDLHATQGLIAFWQAAPLLVDVLLVLFASLPSIPVSVENKKDGRKSDLPHLQRLYLFAAIVSALAHLGTLYCIFFSASASASLSRLAFFAHVFLPSRATWHDSTALGLHWIFQWDWLGVVAASLLWCWVLVCDVLRLLRRTSGGGGGGGRKWLFEVGAAGAAIIAIAVVVGPGTAVAAVWSWREDKLALLEGEDRGEDEDEDGTEAGKRKVA
ncbi:hypothetical protein SLS62_004115 [Diatrype stigma]|uniref:Uncharacterized protein n=1 Tax=Diatrype stigma TaxID=117547 RepID=A0AAN9UU58_9PEZI